MDKLPSLDEIFKTSPIQREDIESPLEDEIKIKVKRGVRGPVGPIGPAGKNGRDGRDARVFVDEKPENPIKGDIWIQN